METRITPLNRWFYIRKTKVKLREADRCIESNTEMINRYLKTDSQNLSTDQSAGFDECNANIKTATSLKDKWIWLLHCLEDDEVYSIEE